MTTTKDISINIWSMHGSCTVHDMRWKDLWVLPVKEKHLKREKLSQPSSGWFPLSLRRFSSFSFLKTSTETRPDFPPESILWPWKKKVKIVWIWSIGHRMHIYLRQIRLILLSEIWNPWTQFAHLWLARPTRRWQIFIWVLSTVWPPPGWRLVRFRASSCFWLLPWRRLVGVRSFSL